MSVLNYLNQLRWRATGQYTRPLPDAFAAPFRGLAALEVGGPSSVFGEQGLLPIYPLLDSVDGVQFAAETFWHGQMAQGEYRPDGESSHGSLWITDGATLDGVPQGNYDAVLSSHVIEHIANPLAALQTWRRACKPDALLMTVAPHMEGTFDHRRAVTTIEHMVADHEAGIGEDDLTHLDESLRLHDHGRDLPIPPEKLAAAKRDNLHTRMLHHHVFTTGSLLALLDRAGLQLLEVEPRRPHDIYVLARWVSPGVPVDNDRLLGPDARWRRNSPFRTDRRRRAA